MQLFGYVVLLVAVFIQVHCIPRITLDDDAQALCKKYKMMCKADKICAVQHFEWPNNITIPVCIPLSFVPVRNMICQLPPDTGRCHARYIRWYFNMHAQECSHFQYGGCEGNQNNFMTKKECEQTCIATPSIRLYDGSSSALSQPSIVTAPIYEPPSVKQYEALNSVMEPANDRYELIRHRTNKFGADEATTRTRRRLDKEKEKERKLREKRKELKRLRKLEKKEQRKLRCKKRRERGKTCKKDRKKKKDKGKKTDDKPETKKDVSIIEENKLKENTKAIVEETKKIITNEIETAEENEQRKRERKLEKRRKRKLEEQIRKEKERNRRNLNTRMGSRYSGLEKRPDSYSAKLFSILDQERQHKNQKNSLLYTLT